VPGKGGGPNPAVPGTGGGPSAELGAMRPGPTFGTAPRNPPFPRPEVAAGGGSGARGPVPPGGGIAPLGAGGRAPPRMPASTL
jgi:hypothetical protein